MSKIIYPVLACLLICTASCKTIILSAGGKLVKVEDKIYEDLGSNKTKVNVIQDKSKLIYNTAQKRNDKKFVKLDSLYSIAMSAQNDLVDKIGKAICKEDSVTYKTYEQDFSAINTAIVNLQDHSSSIGSGFSADSIDDVIIEAAIAVLKKLAKQAALKAYVNAFKDEYYIEPIIGVGASGNSN